MHHFAFCVWREAHNRKHTGRTAYHTKREKHEHHRKIPHTQPEQTKLKRQPLHYQQHDFRDSTYTKLKCKPSYLNPSEQATQSNTHAKQTHHHRARTVRKRTERYYVTEKPDGDPLRSKHVVLRTI
jgi:hypothetical protein